MPLKMREEQVLVDTLCPYLTLFSNLAGKTAKKGTQ